MSPDDNSWLRRRPYKVCGIDHCFFVGRWHGQLSFAWLEPATTVGRTRRITTHEWRCVQSVSGRTRTISLMYSAVIIEGNRIHGARVAAAAHQWSSDLPKPLREREMSSLTRRLHSESIRSDYTAPFHLPFLYRGVTADLGVGFWPQRCVL